MLNFRLSALFNSAFKALTLCLAGVAAALLLPLAIFGSPPSGSRPVSLSVSDDNGSLSFQWSEKGLSLKIQSQGRIDFNDDWTGISHLAPGARMLLVEEKKGAERRLEIRPESNGRPRYDWKVGGKQHAFDAEGSMWLREALLRFVRGTGYAAKERSASIFKRQGPSGLLAEIAQVPGDHVKGLYYAELLAHRDLGAPVVEAALRQAGQQIGSSYLLTNVLVSCAREQVLSEAGVLSYIEAMHSIDSDYDQWRASSALVEKGRLSPTSLEALLKTQKIRSDHYLASVLVEIAGRYELSGRPRAAYLEVAGSIRSKAQRDRAEAALAERSGR